MLSSVIALHTYRGGIFISGLWSQEFVEHNITEKLHCPIDSLIIKATEDIGITITPTDTGIKDEKGKPIKENTCWSNLTKPKYDEKIK